MNYSEILPSIYKYLGISVEKSTERVERLIFECLEELEKVCQFRYLYKVFEDFPEFLKKEPYRGFLSGCESVILSITTLGSEVDRKIRYLGKTDVEKSVIADAAASALLEYYADDFERKIGQNLTYRFCPGYGGSDIADVRYIFELLSPEKIGVSLLDSNLMLPQKSMAGIIGVGKSGEKSCGLCVLSDNCAFKKEGSRCYRSEKK